MDNNRRRLISEPCQNQPIERLLVCTTELIQRSKDCCGFVTYNCMLVGGHKVDQLYYSALSCLFVYVGCGMDIQRAVGDVGRYSWSLDLGFAWARLWKFGPNLVSSTTNPSVVVVDLGKILCGPCTWKIAKIRCDTGQAAYSCVPHTHLQCEEALEREHFTSSAVLVSGSPLREVATSTTTCRSHMSRFEFVWI
ncbi:hypothetical protein J6590_028334 [Homalodisca vitripennis]|nr:hypothetical protein J6590_028334 [Homalodisca vitripennis]